MQDYLYPGLVPIQVNVYSMSIFSKSNIVLGSWMRPEKKKNLGLLKSQCGVYSLCNFLLPTRVQRSPPFVSFLLPQFSSQISHLQQKY